MNKYTDDILIEALVQLEIDESIIDDENEMCIDSVIGDDIQDAEPIF